VRLVGGPNEFEGRVEVCVDGVWARWCAEGRADNESAVICRQLGHIDGGKPEHAVFTGSQISQCIVLWLSVYTSQL
jgi:hypothetical protein